MGKGQKSGRKRIPGKLHTGGSEPSMGLEPKNREKMISAKTKNQTLNPVSHPGPAKGKELRRGTNHRPPETVV